MRMTLPPPRAIIAGTAALTIRNAPVRLIRITRSQGRRAVSRAPCPANRPDMTCSRSGREDPLADDVALVERVRPHLRLPAPDVRGVVPELRHRQARVLDLVGAEVAWLAGGGRA